MMYRLLFTLLVCLAPIAAHGAGDATRGRTAWEERCTGCHSLDANRVGPLHRGVFGRKAGTAPGFAYSPAVRGANIVWDEVLLDRWLTNPQGLIPGQRMNFRIGDADIRADIIAYLKQESGK